MLVQPRDTDSGPEVPEADVLAAAQVHAMLAIADKLTDALDTLTGMASLQKECLQALP